jgi:decaprenyl-phosphate phosphoribosyltransferase
MIVLSLGFLIRPIAGAAVIDIPVSEWFLIVVGFASLFMVSTKRLSEYKKTNSLRTRGVLELYSDRFLESVLTLSIAVTITTYSLWAFSVYPNSIWPKLSIIPVLTALLRYSWLRDRGNAESPELLLFEDKLLPVLGFVGFVFLAIAIYG